MTKQKLTDLVDVLLNLKNTPNTIELLTKLRETINDNECRNNIKADILSEHFGYQVHTGDLNSAYHLLLVTQAIESEQNF